MPTLTDAELSALRAHRWFASCEPALQQHLIEAGRRQRLSAGQALFERGAAAGGLCCVLAGVLRIGAVGRDGSVSLLGYLEAGQWFGEVSLLDGLPRTHDAVAEGASQVWLLPQAPLEAWLDAHPRHWRALARLACAKLRSSFELIEDSSSRLPQDVRLAKRLVLAAHAYGSEGALRRRLRLPQEQLALMLGISRQTVSKILNTFAARRLVALHYGEIELLDVPALRALGDV
ncbi:MAG: Crp/Fnr family transcriptional regulator, partial [Burkholderiaceae bacterium]